MKRLLIAAALLCASSPSALIDAQAINYVPRATAAYISADGTGSPGTWEPLQGAGSSPINYVPSATGIYVSTDGSGKAGTWVPWQGGSGSSTPSLISGSRMLLLPYTQGSGTVLTDQSGNGFNCTFASGANAPTWNSSGTALVFGGNQNCAMPMGAMTGVQTVMMWFAPRIPNILDGARSASMIISDSSNTYVGYLGSGNGLMSTGSGSEQDVSSIDRYIGNSSLAFTYSGSNIAQYINGRQSLGYIINSGGRQWTATGTAMLGDLVAGQNVGWGSSFVLYAMVTYKTVLTPAQIAANNTAMTATLSKYGIHFSDYKVANQLIFSGDSLYQNLGGNYALLSSPPKLIATAAGVTQYVNISLAGQTQATITADVATREYNLLDGFDGGTITVMDNAGTNDIAAGTSAATVLSSLQTYCSALHTRYPGSRVIVSTITPRGNNTSAEETQRETLNSSLISAWLGGTLGCDGLNDVADNPIAATLVTPNNYQPSAASSCNLTYYNADCTHYLPTTTATMGTQGAAALLDVQGNLNHPYWVKVTIPSPVLASFASTSQVLPLLQLGPTWQVCGVKAAVTTAFVGPSISALSLTVGDSTGTATQYLASQSLLSTTSTSSTNSSFVSAHGMVGGTFTATGANLSALTAGNLNVEVCVQSIP